MDLAENFLIQFKNITQKKEAIFANFHVKGLKGGVCFRASLSVDISALNLHSGDSLEKIIEESAKRAWKEFKNSDFQFEGLKKVSDYLGVAQLG